MKDKYEGFKVVVLDYVEPNRDNNKVDSWSTVGIREEFSCPECLYLGKVCDRCKGDM